MTTPAIGIDLSVVVPAHNSAAFIEGTAKRLAERLSDRNAEIIVVENGSDDETLQLCHQLAADWPGGRVSLSVMQSNKGMGNALRKGIQVSHGRLILLTADDLPFGFDDLDAADRLAASSGGQLPPILIGSKAHPESQIARGATRGLLASGFGLLRKLILRTKVGDSQGTFLVNGELLRRLTRYAYEGGFLFTTELVLIAEQAGLRPVEVPVRLAPNHGDHPSRVALSDVAAMAIGLLRIRLRHSGRRRAQSVRIDSQSVR
jgi:dolichyl-phosphate beta-glucosyltransferase